MAVWKAVIVTQSNLDQNGFSEITANIFKDAVEKVHGFVMRAVAGDEQAVIIDHLTIFKNKDEAYVKYDPGTEIILP